MAGMNPMHHVAITETITGLSCLLALLGGMALFSDARSGGASSADESAVSPRQACGESPSDPTPPGCAGALLLPAGSTPVAEELEPSTLTRVPFESLGGHVVVPVRVNESETLHMVLDTGMSAPIILLSRPELAEKLGLKDGQPTLIGGPGGQEPRQGTFHAGAVVSIGGLKLENQMLVAMSACGSPSPCMQDGVIGKSIFDRYLVEIDFDSSTLSIHQGPFDDRGFTSVPLAIQTGIPAIQASVEPESGPEIPVTLVLDLGARHAISIHHNSDKGLVAPRNTLSAVVGRGLQGEISGKVGRLKSLRLGPFLFQGVVSSFTDVEGGTTCGTQGVLAEGNLGTGILNRFTLVIDYPHERLLLKPNSHFTAPFEYNMAGLSLERQEDGTYLVRSVAQDSPGADAGLERGDRIVEIGGHELESSPRSEYTEEFLRDGTRLEVRVERDGSRFDRMLALRRLI